MNYYENVKLYGVPLFLIAVTDLTQYYHISSDTYWTAVVSQFYYIEHILFNELRNSSTIRRGVNLVCVFFATTSLSTSKKIKIKINQSKTNNSPSFQTKKETLLFAAMKPVNRSTFIHEALQSHIQRQSRRNFRNESSTNKLTSFTNGSRVLKVKIHSVQL